MNRKTFFTAKWIAYTAITCSLVIATSFIPPIYIPPLVGGIYWCDCIIFIAGFLLDPFAAFIAGGLGTFFYDLILGNAVMMVVSLIIHGLQGAVVSLITHCAASRNAKQKEWLFALLGAAAGAAIVIGGYFLYYATVAPLFFADKSYGLPYAAVRIPRNIIQEVLGTVIALVICYLTTFKKQLEKSNLLPDYGREVKQEPAAQDER